MMCKKQQREINKRQEKLRMLENLKAELGK